MKERQYMTEDPRGLFIFFMVCLVTVAFAVPVGVAAEDAAAPAPAVPLAASFQSNISRGTAPLPVQFTDLSTGSPDRWNWSFGDLTFSEEQNPVHTFLSPGLYPVNLTVGNPYESSTRIVPSSILVTVPDPPGVSLSNGGFETGDLSSWTAGYGTWERYPGSSSSVTIDTASAHTGTYGAHLVLHADADKLAYTGAYVQQVVGNIQEGDTLSFWVKIPRWDEGDIAPDRVWVRLERYYTTEAGTIIDGAAWPELGGVQDWTRYEITCPPGKQYGHDDWRLVVHAEWYSENAITSDSDLEMYVDDFTLQTAPVPSETPTPPSLAEEYCFEGTWGSQGSGNGQFIHPNGVAADSAGNVFVADSGNHRIQKFDPAGNFLLSWGRQGTGNGQFDFPDGITVDPLGNVYVVDSGNDRIQKFDPAGNFLAAWGSPGPGDGQFYSPHDIAADAAGNIYVTDSDTWSVQKFSPAGDFLTRWKFTGYLASPAGIAVDSAGNIFVAEWYNQHIRKFNSAGDLLATWGSEGAGYGQFRYPGDLTADTVGNVYVTDTGNHRVQKFDPAGNFLSAWGSDGTADGEFLTPTCVAVNSRGRVFVGDTDGNRIQKFGPCGQPEPEPEPEPEFPAGGGTFTRISTGTGLKDHPAIDGDRVIWVDSRNGNNDIYLFDLSTGTERQITTDPSPQDYPRISGDRIVYTDGRSGSSWQIFLHDLKTGRETHIGTGANELFPDISGDRIVWQDERGNKAGLYLYDLSTSQETRIAPDAVTPMRPAISGNRVVYADNRDGNTDIYLYDLGTGQERRITSNPAYSLFPDIDGNLLVWDETPSGSYSDAYLIDLAGGSGTRISSTPGSEKFARISGGLVTWQWFSPAGNENVVMYDIANRTATQITPNAGSKGEPDVSGNRIVWREIGQGTSSIVVFTWNGNPVKYLVADLHVNRQSTPALEPLTFNDTSYGSSPAYWGWNFGDGTGSALRNPVHTYRNPGTYSVTLTVSTDAGLTDTITKPGYIQVTEALTEEPVPDFSADPTFGIEPLAVAFADRSSGFPSSWLWDFGDGTSSTDQVPTHQYASAGVYDVSLTAQNHLGPNTTVRKDYITVVSLAPPPPPPPPFPTVSTLTPSSIAEGSSGFTLRVTGTNFTSDSKVQFAKKEVPTRLISGTVLEADVPSSRIPKASDKPYEVRVYTLWAGGMSEAGPPFYVTPANTVIPPAPTPTPAPQPGALVLSVTPKQHWVQEYQLLGYDIDVFQDDHLVPADIEVKLDGNVIGSFRASHYTYEFYPPSVDEHYLEISAKDGNRRALPDPWRQKILSYGSITPALLMADAMHTAADNEIAEGETLAAEKSVDFVDTNKKKIEESVLDLAIDFGFGDQMKDAVWSWWPGLAHESPEFFRMSSTMIMLRGYVETYIPGLIGRAATLLPDPEQQKEYEISNMKDRLHSNLNIGYFTDSIGRQSDAFRAHIENNPGSYLLTEDLKYLFGIHTAPLNYVVDDYQFPFPYTLNDHYVLTMRQMADEYDQVKNIGEGLDLSLLVSRMTTSSAGIALNCGADLAGTGVLDGVFAAVNSGMQVLAVLANSLSVYFVTLQVFQVVTMQNFVFPLASAVDGLHASETSQIANHQVPASFQSANLMIEAGDTWILSPTEISSSGTSMIVTPDGRIVDFIEDTGSYTPKSAGTYTVVSYPNSGATLADAAKTTFEAGVPRMTLETSHSITDRQTRIHTQVCSQEESTAGDLSLQVIVVDTTGKPVAFDGETFSLEGNACSDSDFDITLPGDGIYVVHVLLAQHLLVPLDEQTFSVNSGNIILSDAAILGIEYKPVYLAFEPVVLTTTLESFAPDFTFHLTVPDLGYDEVVTMTGIRDFSIALPPLTPGQYSLAVVAEADGKVLDARILSINIEAEGVGLVGIMPDGVYYPLGEPVGARFTLKDVLMNPLDADGHVTVIDPDGQISEFSTPIGNGKAQFTFTPPTEGTYMIEGTASKPGWRISGDRTLFIVGNMSPILMDVQKDGINYTVRTYANGLPAPSYLTITSESGSEELFAGDRGAVFNRTGSFSLVADKMFYEPAYYSYTAPETLPTADFEANMTAGTAPLAVRFNDASLGQDLSSWTWAFGDTTYAYEQNPEHVYEKPGIYSVTLTVANISGSDYLTRTDYIVVAAPVPPAAGYTADQQSGKAPLTVSFTDTSTGGPRSWYWTFGDGSASDLPNPVHEFTKPGSYDVSLTVTNRAGSDTRTEAGFVTVLPKTPPVADFAGSPESGHAPLTVIFTDLSASGPASWQWDFGDGATSTAQNPSHVYTTPGVYMVTLTAVNPDGTDRKTRQNYITVTVPPVPPVARFSASPVAGKVPLTTVFTDRSTGSPATWQWTFGDGQASDQQSPVHVYNRPGIYIARLKVSNSAGSDTAWSLVLVLPSWIPWFS